MDSKLHSKSHNNTHLNREPIKTSLSREDSKKEQAPKKSLSTKDKIRRFVFVAIMKYSLAVGLIAGLLIVFLNFIGAAIFRDNLLLNNIFLDAFLPLNLFLLMMGTIYTIFNFKEREELFTEFVVMVVTIGFVVILLAYVTNTLQFTPLTEQTVRMIFTHLQYMLTILVNLFTVPCIYSSVRLLFFPKK